MIITKEVDVILSGRNIKHYESLGYLIPRVKNINYKLVVKEGTKIKVKVSDLLTKSHIKVLCKCEECGKENWIAYCDFTNRNNDKYRCKKCSGESVERSINQKGILGNNWKGGWRNKLPFCEDCGKKLKHKNSKICYTCRGKRNRSPNTTKYKIYRNSVDTETRKHIEELFKFWDGLDYYTKEDITKLPVRDITIDHKISVYYGFTNNINPIQIGKLENLCICSRKTNCQKHKLTEEEFKQNF